jgi:hypothetical protein
MIVVGVKGIFSLAPGFGGDFRDLPVSHLGEPSQDVAQITVRVQTTTPAALNGGVEDRAAISHSGFADEEPVLRAQGRGPN